MTKKISVFGTARSKEGDLSYEEAKALGYALAKEGYAVVTGGYGGAMEAVSRGAHEAGGTVYGITMTAFTQRNTPNRWVHHIEEMPNLMSRIERLLISDGFVAVDGGIGTLAEITMAWNLLQIDAHFCKPLILMGANWASVVEHFRHHLVTNDSDYAWVQLAENPQKVTSLLHAYLRNKQNLTPADKPLFG